MDGTDTVPTQRTEATAIGRALTVTIALWLIATGLTLTATAATLNGVWLIGGPALVAAGTAVLVRVRRVTG